MSHDTKLISFLSCVLPRTLCAKSLIVTAAYPFGDELMLVCNAMTSS